MVVDGKVLIGNEDGKLTVLKAGGEKPQVLKEFDTVKYSSIYSTPTVAGDRDVSVRSQPFVRNQYQTEKIDESG